MTLRTRDDYLKSIRGLKPNVYKFGRLIEDVTTDPATTNGLKTGAVTSRGKASSLPGP